MLGPQSFPDGLSHTVAYSDRLRGTGAGGGLTHAQDFGNIMVMNYCTTGTRTTPWYVANWLLPRASRPTAGADSLGSTAIMNAAAYNHAQEPNGQIPDALQGGPWFGIATARSLHPGGVNSLMADGSVRFVKGSIARMVWRGLGTRNGDELVE